MKIRATWKKRIWGMALALCITLPALAQPALAAEEYIPGNPRWSGYKNQVQWDKPENAGSSDSFEYEAHLLLEGEVLENQTSEIQPYVFFSSDTVTLPQEEYTIRVRARWIMIVGDPDGQYMVADVGDWGPWASSGPEADGPAPAAAGSGKVELTFPDNGVSVSLQADLSEDAELYADTMAAESLLCADPGLEAQLPGLLSVYEISIRQSGRRLELGDIPIEIRIPLNDHLKSQSHHQAVYLGEEPEPLETVSEGDALIFEAPSPGRIAILGSDKPFVPVAASSDSPQSEASGTASMESKTPETSAQASDGNGSEEPVSPDSPQAEEPEPEKDDGETSYMAVGLIVAAAVAAGVTAFILLSRRKKASSHK